jgi:hypothetical protein
MIIIRSNTEHRSYFCDVDRGYLVLNVELNPDFANTMAEETDSEQLLHKLYEQVNEHLETRWTYFTLSATEKMAKAASGMASALTIVVFALLVLFFFSMGFAWWLGDFIGNRAGGFALAGLVFIPIAYLVYRWIGPFVQEKVIGSALHEPKKTDEIHE